MVGVRDVAYPGSCGSFLAKHRKGLEIDNPEADDCSQCRAAAHLRDDNERCVFMFLIWRAFLIVSMLSFEGIGDAQTVQTPSCTSPAGASKVTVSGTVSDSTGARITSATVHVACGNHSQQAKTDGQGHYSVAVPEGTYLLQVEAAGFAIYTRDLSINTSSPTADATLAVQNASNTVTVQAEVGYVANESTLATKTDTPLLETPQSISVVTRDQMERRLPRASTRPFATLRVSSRSRREIPLRSGMQAAFSYAASYLPCIRMA
jgi:hypothetical protein